VELDLVECFELGCLPNSIVDLAQLKTFRLCGCPKLENLPMEFGKLQSLVELDLSECSELGCLPDSIVDLAQLKTFDCAGARNWRICQWSSGNFKALWNFTYLVVPSWVVYMIQLWICRLLRRSKKVLHRYLTT
jgi:hypothetical protein